MIRRALLLTLLLFTVLLPNAFSTNMFTLPLYKDGITNNPFKPEKDETIINRTADQNSKGLNRAIYNVTVPELQISPATQSDSPNPAVVVFPGGGFTHVTIDKEGYDVAEWLNSIGITAIIVKYRTVPENIDRGSDQFLQLRDAIVKDAMKALRLSHMNAQEWNIDTNRIGVMGFSAGGNLSATILTRINLPEGIDYESEINPAFACLIYPGLTTRQNDLVNSTLPPVFIAVAMDDNTTPAPKSIAFFEKLYEFKVPSELYIFVKGSHGFGMGRNKGVVESWSFLCEKWLAEIGIIDNK